MTVSRVLKSTLLMPSSMIVLGGLPSAPSADMIIACICGEPLSKDRIGTLKRHPSAFMVVSRSLRSVLRNIAVSAHHKHRILEVVDVVALGYSVPTFRVFIFVLVVNWECIRSETHCRNLIGALEVWRKLIDKALPCFASVGLKSQLACASTPKLVTIWPDVTPFVWYIRLHAKCRLQPTPGALGALGCSIRGASVS